MYYLTASAVTVQVLNIMFLLWYAFECIMVTLNAIIVKIVSFLRAAVGYF